MNIPGCFAVVMSQFNWERKLLQHRELFRQHGRQEWRQQKWRKVNETRKTVKETIKNERKEKEKGGWKKKPVRVCVCVCVF